MGLLSGSAVLCSDLSHKAGPASAIAAVSSYATTPRESSMLAFAEFKVASFQLGSEIPFQPLEWPGELQPRGPGSIMMPGTIVPLFPNQFPGNHTTCAIVPSALLPGHVAQLTQGHREVCLCSGAHNDVASRFGGTLGEDQGCFTSQCSQGLGIFPPGLSNLEKSRQQSEIGLKEQRAAELLPVIVAVRTLNIVAVLNPPQ